MAGELMGGSSTYPGVAVVRVGVVGLESSTLQLRKVVQVLVGLVLLDWSGCWSQTLEGSGVELVTTLVVHVVTMLVVVVTVVLVVMLTLSRVFVRPLELPPVCVPVLRLPRMLVPVLGVS